MDRLRSDQNVLSVEQQTLEYVPQNDESKNTKECKQDDDIENESPASSHSGCLPNSTLDADTWVKAAEFVPGQLWQSVGKWG